MPTTKELQQRIHQKLQSGEFEMHTLESLPLTHLFHVLWEGSTNWCLTHRVSRPTKDKASFVLRRIPDTVVWENNIPKGWYKYEEETEELPGGKKVKIGNIKKDKVDTKKVDYSFTNGKLENEIVAMYLAKVLDGAKEVIRIDYLTTTNLRAFLFTRNRGKGTCLLQRWVEPQNREYNDVIQAVWTSGLKCLVERRRNKTHLLDERYSLRERCVTFDGPPHLSSATNLSQRLIEQVRLSCVSIAEHFRTNASLTRQHPKHEITRMIVQFKIDVNCHLVLLGVLGVRVPNTLRKKDLFVALDLAPVYQHVTHAAVEEPTESAKATSHSRRASIQTVEAPSDKRDADEDDFSSWLAGRVKAGRRSVASNRRLSKMTEPSKKRLRSISASTRTTFDHTAWRGNAAIWGKHGGGFITRNDAGSRKQKQPKLKGLEKRIIEKLMQSEKHLTNKPMSAARVNMFTKMVSAAHSGPEMQVISRIKEQFFQGLDVAPTSTDVDDLEPAWSLLSSHIQKRRQTDGTTNDPAIHSRRRSSPCSYVAASHGAKRHWQILKAAVKSRFILSKMSSQALIQDLTDAVYMLESNRLLKNDTSQFRFTVRDVPDMLEPFIKQFTEAVNATLVSTDTPNEKCYEIQGGDIPPVHTCDIALQNVIRDISKTLSTRQQAVLRNDDGGAAHILYALGSLVHPRREPSEGVTSPSVAAIPSSPLADFHWDSEPNTSRSSRDDGDAGADDNTPYSSQGNEPDEESPESNTEDRDLPYEGLTNDNQSDSQSSSAYSEGAW